jgi:hypothetical protein
MTAFEILRNIFAAFGVICFFCLMAGFILSRKIHHDYLGQMDEHADTSKARG